MNKNKFLLDYFLKNRIIGQRVYDEALKQLDDESFDCLDFLLKNNHITQQEKMYALSYYFNLPYIDMDMVKSKIKLSDMFSIELLKKFCFVPLKIIDDTLIVVASNPNIPQIKQILSVSYNQKISFVISDEDKIMDYINSYQSMMSSKDALSSIIENTEVKTKNDDEVFVQNAPSVKFDYS